MNADNTLALAYRRICVHQRPKQIIALRFPSYGEFIQLA